MWTRDSGIERRFHRPDHQQFRGLQADLISLLAPQSLSQGNEKMTDKQPTARQREKWRTDRARLRAMRLVFPSPPKPKLTPEEKRELKNAKAREAREAKALGACRT
jgi:hypothetical protein